MIRHINELEYLIAFDQYRTAFSNRCVRESLNGGVLIGAEKDGMLAGYLCATKDGDNLRVLYAFTVPDARKCGVFSELLYSLTQMDASDRSGTHTIRVSISAGHAFREAVAAACLKLGFDKTESVTVFKYHRDEAGNWQKFMEEKGNKMCSLLGRWGYETVSFEEATDDVISQLRDPESHGYGSTFDVASFLDNPAKKTAYDMSFAAVLDGRLAAYTLVTRDSSDGIVFQIISDSEWARGTGVILLPFAKSVNSFFEGDYRTALYAMYGSNKAANDFRKGSALGCFYTESSETENYHYIFNDHI